MYYCLTNHTISLYILTTNRRKLTQPKFLQIVMAGTEPCPGLEPDLILREGPESENILSQTFGEGWKNRAF